MEGVRRQVYSDMTAIMCRLFGHRRQIDISQMFSGALVTCARCDYRSPGRRTYLFGSPRAERQ